MMYCNSLLNKKGELLFPIWPLQPIKIKELSPVNLDKKNLCLFFFCDCSLVWKNLAEIEKHFSSSDLWSVLITAFSSAVLCFSQ